MPNSSKLAQIRAQYNAQQEALNARRREGIAHLIDSPVAHWCGVRENVLQVLRSNRDALTAQEAGAYAPVQPVAAVQLLYRRLGAGDARRRPQPGRAAKRDQQGDAIAAARASHWAVS